MRAWGLIVGALLGWLLADFEPFGLGAGAVVGLLTGMALRKAVRAEIAAAHAEFARDWAPANFQTAAVAEPIAAPVPVVETALPVDETPPPEPLPPIPDVPREPGMAELGIAAARDWLFGGNTIVRAGLVILFVGLSFLARYAAQAGLFPVELRLTLIAAAGAALLGVGYTRRLVRPAFGLALQGTGIAAIYLTVFAAARMFGVVGIVPAFGIMVVVCALSCALALLQNSQGLAAAAFAGGFAVPVLLSTGGGDAAVLFGYYTVLNLAVLFIAQRRAWRAVNLIGFFATFGIATAWGVLSYRPENYAMAQSFLIAFVLIYVAAAILYARRTPGRLGGVVDSTLLFGPALAGFGLQVGLVRNFEFGSAFSALGFGALYLVLAGVARRRGGDTRVLTESMIAIGVGFATLAVPLALGAQWTSSVWALEGAGAFWVGMRQARWLPRMFGLALQFVAAVTFLATLGDNVSALPLLGGAVIGALLIALPGLAVAWWLRRPLEHSGSRFATIYAGLETLIGKPMFLYGFAFAWLALALEAMRRLPPVEAGAASVAVLSDGTQRLLIMLAFVAAAALAAFVGRKRDWVVATWPSRVTLVPIAFTLLGQMSVGEHVLSSPDWAIWLATIALHYVLLRANDRDGGWLSTATHAAGAWVVTLMIADCLWFGIERGELWRTSWASVVLLVSATAVLVALAVTAARQFTRWPLDRYAVAYYWIAALPLAALVFVGTLVTALTQSGITAPLPYLPLLNPVDLSLALGLAALFYWRREIVRAAPAGSAWLREPATIAPLAGLAFIAVNSVWLRIAHHQLGVDWSTSAMLESFVVQTGLAILWTLLALGLMLFAHRRGLRTMWLTGAGLLGLVVVKLLLVDLSNSGGGERIVTFVAVGVLMLVVGYFAPLPPRAPEPVAA